MTDDSVRYSYEEWEELLREAELDAVLSPILNAWEALKLYLTEDAEHIEEQIAAIEKDIQKGKVASENQGMPPVLQDHFSLLERHDELGRTLRRSFVVSACSFLESTLIDACSPYVEDEVEDYYDELHHMGDRIQELLKRLFPGDKRGQVIGEKRWNFLCDLVKIRNFIVHANGNQALAHKNPTPEHLDNIVKREPGLDWRPAAYTAELGVHDEYCDKVADLLEFLTRLIFAEQ